MARPVWSGTISFGLVSVPVAMFSATAEHQPAFHQFAAGTSDRIRYRRVNERTGEEVEHADIVKGVEVGDGYVMVSDDELDAIAPGRSRALEIDTFVDLAEVDPVYFNKAYYLAPAAEEHRKTYALLREAMASTNRAAVAGFVMHGKQHLALIRATGRVLVLSTLFYADEVRDPRDTVEGLPTKTSFGKGELTMATQLIDSMTQNWKPEHYRDEYTDRVNELIEAKHKGHEVVPADEAPVPTNVTDLMEALRRSVDAAKKRPARKSTKKATPAKKATAAKKSTGKKVPAKKTAAKKTPARKAS